MPIMASLPPLPSHEAFDDLRLQVEEATSQSTNAQFAAACVEQRRTWRKLAALLANDDGEPTKRLTVSERAEKRKLEAAGVTAADIAAMVDWFGKAIDACHAAKRKAA